MTGKYTQERIIELLEDIARLEQELRPLEDNPMTAPTWATLVIAKAKLTSMQGEDE
jgi:hypothetical protein